MPYCPNCRTEYRAGFATCSDCESDLVEALPDPVEDKVREPCKYEPVEWVVVATTRDRIEAELLKGLLQSSGLPVYLEGEALGSLYGLQTGPLAQVKVLVPSRALGLARDILGHNQGLDKDDP